MVYPAQEETIKEEVLVVNVEVPVRVFFKGKAVEHLTRDDFLVYEGKKLQKINGFFIKKRKISGQHALPKTETDPESYLPSRYFVLNFSISDYNKELQEGLGYFFDNILRDDDQLVGKRVGEALDIDRSRDGNKCRHRLGDELRPGGQFVPVIPEPKEEDKNYAYDDGRQPTHIIRVGRTPQGEGEHRPRHKAPK